MKLELKHIAPYLPYQLKCKYNDGLHYGESKIVAIDFQGVKISGIELWVFYKQIKPILRPVSDLKNKECDFWIEFGTKIDELQTDYLIDSIANNTFYAKDIHFAFKVYEVLFEMHFDVFGLIEKGLAIDVNTL